MLHCRLLNTAVEVIARTFPIILSKSPLRDDLIERVKFTPLMTRCSKKNSIVDAIKHYISVGDSIVHLCIQD